MVTMKYKKSVSLFLILCLCSSCYRIDPNLHPQIQPIVQDRHLKNLPSAFPSLISKDPMQDWEKEAWIGLKFGHELELYPALIAFKRSCFLLDPSEIDKQQQITYYMVLCYYLGKKYLETLAVFETSTLPYISSAFPAYHDLLIILYDSYLKVKNEHKAHQILEYMKPSHPEVVEKLAISEALLKADLKKLTLYQESYPKIRKLLSCYDQGKKSPNIAQALNVILPGTGYFYLGQIQSGITAFLVNSLCIWASIYSFQHHNYAAGIIFTSVEAGWYFGGIYGAGLEAKTYNERLYEKYALPLIYEEQYFPLLMLKYAF